jgi:hypothetical protein
VDARPRADHRGIVHAHPGELHGEVGLDGRGQVGGAALEEVEPAIRELPSPQVAHGAALAVAVHPVDEVAEQQVFGRDGRVGFELAHPVPVRLLECEELRLSARDGGVEARHGS